MCLKLKCDRFPETNYLMKILFTSGTMSGGGAERVIANLSSIFIKNDKRVDILITRGSSVYPLDEGVTLKTIYNENEFKKNVINKIHRRLIYIPRIISRVKSIKPDVIITMHGGGWNALFILISKYVGTKVIACEHTSHSNLSRNFLSRLERHLIYRFADAITVLTNKDYIYYSSILKNVHKIPNPATFECIKSSTQRENVILAVGRLDAWHIKGFDNLISIFHNVLQEHPEWKLKIVGSGSKGNYHLRNLAKQFNITNSVDFIEFDPNIDKIMQKASIFVLPSRYEGFGMALIEAMSQGCACISFDCEFGPADIINHNVDGVLVKNQDNNALAMEIKKLIKDEILRKKLSTSAIKNIQRFSSDNIFSNWSALFNKIGY